MTFSFHRYLAVLLGLIALSACQPSVQQDENTELMPPKAQETSDSDRAFSKLLTHLADENLIPGYQLFDERLRLMNHHLLQGCADQELNVQEITTLQADWRLSMQSWQAVKWFSLGPVNTDNRHSRIQYWPDGNRAVKRGVEKLLAGETPELKTLQNFNVGAQGLPALEMLLFARPENIPAAKYCDTMRVINENLTEMSRAILAEWLAEDGFRQKYVSGKGDFSSLKDAVEESFSNWFAQLSLINDNKISYPMGLRAPGVPGLAESPFADTSMSNIRANFANTKTILMEPGHFTVLALLQENGSKVLVEQITSQALKLEESLNGLPDSLTKALANNTERQQLLTTTTELGKLQSLLVEDMPVALQLNIGFNALDGD